MIQKNIRDWGGVPYTNAEADELTQELNDRTASSQAGYNSVNELATKMKSAETNINLKEDKSDKGSANGYAELDATGKVPAAQLPAGTDEVQEYANLAAFPATGSSSVIYVALDTDVTYRWGGTVYVEISASLALGETSTTAYRGDRGKIAYDHSLTAHAPADAEANQSDVEIKTQYENNANTNAYTDAEKTKLSQIEDSATADQTATEIEGLYEGVADTNKYTDAEKAKVALTSGTNTGDQDLSNYSTLTGDNVFTGYQSFNAESGHLAGQYIKGDSKWYDIGDVYRGSVTATTSGLTINSFNHIDLTAGGILKSSTTVIADINTESKALTTREYTDATYGDITQVATNKTNADASKIKTDFITVTQAVNLDTIETNSNASKVKTDFITVTGAIDLDSNVPLLNAANTFSLAGNQYTNGLTIGQTIPVLGFDYVGKTGTTGIAVLNNDKLAIQFENTTACEADATEFRVPLDPATGDGVGNRDYNDARYGAIADVSANTAKISFDSTSSTRLANTSGTNTGDQDISGIGTNASAITAIEAVTDVAIVSDTTSAGGGTAITNMVEITQAAYDLLTPDANTFYLING